MNKKNILIALSLLTIISSSTLKAQSTVKEITDQFFKIYEESPQKAVEYVFSTNKWLEEENKDEVENIKTELASFFGESGDYYGYEIITKKSLGESYKLVSYMMKYDRQPFRINLVFYKPKDKWQIESFNYDAYLNNELIESGRVYRLKENKE